MDFSKVQAYLEQLVADGLPFAQLFVTKGRKTVFSYNVGWADAAKTVPITDSHLCWCFSNTKVYTAVCLMRLVEEGKLSLDDPVSKYLPEFAETRCRKGDGIVKTDPPTLRHLISMTSGLTYDLGTKYTHFAEAFSRPGATTREAVAALAQEVLSFEPGTDYFYGWGHDVIAVVIEAATGMRFSDYVRRTIFEPLGIRDTGFHPDAEQRSQFAQMSRYDGAALAFRPIPTENRYVFNGNYDSGGGGMFSCPKEYCKLLTALACGGTGPDGYRVLKPETIDQMTVNQLCPKALNSFRTKGIPGHRIPNKAGCGYALGVRTHMDPAASGRKTSIGEFGWTGAAGALSLVDRERELAFCYTEQVMQHKKSPENPKSRSVYQDIHMPLINLICDAVDQ